MATLSSYRLCSNLFFGLSGISAGLLLSSFGDENLVTKRLVELSIVLAIELGVATVCYKNASKKIEVNEQNDISEGPDFLTGLRMRLRRQVRNIYLEEEEVTSSTPPHSP